VLEARGLTKRYDRRPVVDNLSFTIARGEVLGLLGANGSGKSTTVKMIIGLVAPSEGEVLLDGRPVGSQALELKRRLGYVPEEAHVYGHLSAQEYLELVGRLRGLAEGTVARRSARLLELLGLGIHRHALLGELSKGMRQKVLISAALLHDPDLLVLDEPLSGLDVSSALVFRALILELARRGKSILYSSHVLPAVEQTCNRVVILHEGKPVAHDEIGRLKELMSSPSLENVFRRLAVSEDPEATALSLAEAVRE